MRVCEYVCAVLFKTVECTCVCVSMVIIYSLKRRVCVHACEYVSAVLFKKNG